MTITLVQLPNKTVASAHFRYVMTMSAPQYQTPKAIVAASMFEFIERFGGMFGVEDWTAVEASLAKEHVWTREIGDQRMQSFVVKCFNVDTLMANASRSML